MDSILRIMTRSAYDLQKMRIETGNRLVANFRAKLGLDPKTTDSDEDQKEIDSVLNDLERRYRLITDDIVMVTRKNKQYEYDGVISTYTELVLVGQYLDLRAREKRQFNELKYALEAYPIYNDFLKDIKGVGPAMAAVIISEIDITKAKYVSSIWKYAGVDVAEDGAGRSRRKEHLHEIEYTNKDGERTKRVGITFNPLLKTKLIGVLGSSFLRAGDNKYSQVYRDYKHRLENHAVYGIANEAARKEEMEEKYGKKYAPVLHRHRMANRYMIKIFLADLYDVWRRMEGLEVHVPYHEAKLGMKHGV